MGGFPICPLTRSSSPRPCNVHLRAHSFVHAPMPKSQWCPYSRALKSTKTANVPAIAGNASPTTLPCPNLHSVVNFQGLKLLSLMRFLRKTCSLCRLLSVVAPRGVFFEAQERVWAAMECDHSSYPNSSQSAEDCFRPWLCRIRRAAKTFTCDGYGRARLSWFLV